MLPLWEATLGIGSIYAPIYRGSTDWKFYALPFPYLQYRGERLRVDSGGIERRLFFAANAKVDLSFAGGLPAPAEEGGAREGMPDLDPTGEAGLAVTWVLRQDLQRDARLAVRLPTRAVFTLARGIDHTGWVIAPNLEYRINRNRADAWGLALVVGPQFAANDYHDYYYAVTPQFARPTRPAYDARAGYSGSRVTLTLGRNWGTYSMGLLLRYDYLNGAVFDDSPLVQTRHYGIVALALNWIYAKSERRVRGGGD